MNEYYRGYCIRRITDYWYICDCNGPINHKMYYHPSDAKRDVDRLISNET